MIDIVRTVDDLRERVRPWKAEGARIGVVPTMGALHAGHLALVDGSLAECDRTVVTLFVNPTQFGRGEDLGAYPRTEDEDAEKLTARGAHLLFAPGPDEMYPDGFDATIHIGGVTADLEGSHRPGHFEGVATVVAKLILQSLADVAWFGEKDYQQLCVVRKLVRDLNLPCTIAGVPTVREADGLALSSRNIYLDSAQRKIAPELYRILNNAADRISRGAEVAPTEAKAARLLILAGFAYKVSVVPFHFWTPDVYEGAPTPVTTFLAVASKAAGFGALLRFLGVLFAAPGTQEIVADYGRQVGLLIAVLAAVTMTLGNLGALKQDSVKRMLAYSSIAHAGYVLMGVVAMSAAGFEAAMVYLAAYYFMNLGAFGFLLYFQSVTGKDTYESLRGMGYRAPVISIAMVAFLVSLTGLPPTVGFYGKYALFAACWQDGFAWLVVVAALNSVVSLFYYIKVGAFLFLSDPAQEKPQPQPVLVGFIVALAVATVMFGMFADPLVNWASASLDILAAR